MWAYIERKENKFWAHELRLIFFASIDLNFAIFVEENLLDENFHEVFSVCVFMQDILLREDFVWKFCDAEGRL